MKHLAPALSLSLLLLAGGAVAQTPPPAADTDAVVKALETRDCAAAASALNAGLAAQPSPQLLLLAGSMFEHGLCLKPSAERAARLYLRAQDQPGAPARLAALYASPAAGPDKGLALWWGQRAGLLLPAECQVATDARQDPDRFATALGAWRPQTLDGCVFVVGVMAMVAADFVTATAVAGEGLPVQFTPATGEWLVTTGQLGNESSDAGGTGALRGSAPGLQRNEPLQQPDVARARAREALRALVPRVESLGRDALTRFPRPAGINPGWRLNFTITDLRR